MFEIIGQRRTRDLYLNGAKLLLDFVKFFHISNTKRENLLQLNRHNPFCHAQISYQLKVLPTSSPKFR